MEYTIVVAGAGTMGRGIAQVCAQYGFTTFLFDAYPGVIEQAQRHIQTQLDTAVAKQKMTPAQAAETMQRLHFTNQAETVSGNLLIEAIIEDLPAKVQLFETLGARLTNDAILATNTSSLSIAALQQHLPHYASRIAGLHFFNPAPLMKLVEVISGPETSTAVSEALVGLCQQLGKTPVSCLDAPGFIVNRVARHYYLEAMNITAEQQVEPATLDRLLESAGFRMGPFKLMDLIGHDINLAVSQSLYEAFQHEVRFKPSPLQEKLVAEGQLGRKTGRGFYSYT